MIHFKHFFDVFSIKAQHQHKNLEDGSSGESTVPSS